MKKKMMQPDRHRLEFSKHSVRDVETHEEGEEWSHIFFRKKVDNYENKGDI